METATLFTVGRIRGTRTMSILNNVILWGKESADSIGDYVDEGHSTAEGEKREILTALEAVVKLEKGN